MLISTYLVSFCTLFINLFSGAGRTFYISPKGSDTNNGLHPSTAWQSIGKINQLSLKPGDKVLLEGGSTFKGIMKLDELDQGEPSNKIRIGSYGKMKAIIEAGDGTGIYIYNAGGISITDIVVKGTGVATNRGNGIHFYADKVSDKINGIEINNCEVTGFHGYGILIQSDKDTACGFSNVEIRKCKSSENGEAGIASLAVYPSVAHHNFLLSKCVAFNNRGILSKTDNHSGNGIVLSGVTNFLIDSCEAYENGADCRSEGGGPVGIWIWNARSGKIQHSFSHNNHSGTSIHDGGGFDIDGGSSDCIIRNCISSDNEGAGYLLCEFGSPLPYTNNKIENNTSKNDGLKNNYGAITISGAGKDYPVTNCIIQNNVIIVENRNTVDGIPAALYFNGSDFRSMTIRQNSFDARNGSRMLYIDTLFSKDQVVFRKNKFPAAQKEFTMFCNKCISADTIYWKQRLQTK